MNVKQLREGAGLTQEELGQQSGGRRYDICRFERGQYLPRPEMAEKMAIALSAALSTLFDEKEKDMFFHALTGKTPKKATVAPDRDIIRHSRYIQIRARIPREMRPALDIWLRDAGYASVTDWIIKCLHRLQQEAERKRRKRENGKQP